MPRRDTFRPSEIDLRGLNEEVAGQNGFVRLARDGESFVLGDGSPVRFWATITYVQRDRSPAELAHHARFLAKHGVNMVRLHGALEPKGEHSRLDEVDTKVINEAWRLVAAMKKEGIYVTISPFWSAGVKRVPREWGLESWPENMGPFGLLFFNPRLQQAYKSWLRALLTPANPYTGIPLAKDPALAIIQIQNEDSLLFWSAQNIKGKQAELLGRLFGDWLKAKYGSLQAAYQAWEGERVGDDKPEQGIVSQLLVWEWTQPRKGGRKKRLDDQLRFATETMYNFNREIGRYLREELGCRQLVNAGNWKTADALRLDDAERVSYTANEVLAVNRYFSPVHIGPDRTWRIDPGDSFEDASVLLRPRELPLNLKQAVGHPMIVTESLWVAPVGYQSEGPFLAAAYQSLSGVDIVYWLGSGDTEWAGTDRAEWDSASRSKWICATPMTLGQFPAAALLFRKGYVKVGQPVVEEHRSLRQIWEREPPVLGEDAGYDPFRDLGDTARRATQAGPVDPLAFLVGPVRVDYDSDPARTKVADLGRFIDHERKVIRSNTGELTFDYGRGLCLLDSPRAQGATGFLGKAGDLRFSNIAIRCENEYASVLVVSLDGEPLATSKRALVQVGTHARPTGWVERAATFTGDGGKKTFRGKQIVSTGKMPWAVEDTKIILNVKSQTLKTATVLDTNGYERGALDVDAKGDVIALRLPRAAMYVVLHAL